MTKTFFTARLRLSLIAGLFVLLAACGSHTETVKAPPSSYIRLSLVPPPDPLPEKPQTPEDPTMEVWRPGHWSYDGNSFKWVPGRLMPKPYPTASWVQDRWFKHTYGWGFVPGHWM